MIDITKDFPGIRANDHITLRLQKGEIHALLGENGAGKSTLMSILFGLHQPTSGAILKAGEPVKINNPKDANNLGIGMVHQHFKLVHNFTVLQNIILGVETVFRGTLQMDNARKKVMALSKRYGFMIDPDAKIEDITVGMQQRVEILKMLYRNNEILILDEPTAVLTPQEIDELMKILRELKAEGKSILFITHKLNEIMAVADRCTVLRKGRCVGTVSVKDQTPEQFSRMMVGRDVDFVIRKKKAVPGEVVLSVKGLTVSGKGRAKKIVNDVSFDVRRGEIVCIAGIDGNGQSEIVHALTGLVPVEKGTITYMGTPIENATVRSRNDRGISHIPEDRHKHGLVLDFTLSQNMILKNYHHRDMQHHGFIDYHRMRKRTDELIEQYDIRSGQGGETTARSMSGGNQQKAIVAREIGALPNLLIAVQPTRGLDVGAIEYIHRKLVAVRDEGKAVLLVSLELEEVMNLSDRILVAYEGEIVAELNPGEVTVQELGLYMAGSKRREAK